MYLLKYCAGSAGVIWALAVTCARTWFAEDEGFPYPSAGEMRFGRAQVSAGCLSQCSAFFTIKQSPAGYRTCGRAPLYFFTAYTR